jgi:tripartite-type tricarboxylate transporter receptor subunit TctC
MPARKHEHRGGIGRRAAILAGAGLIGLGAAPSVAQPQFPTRAVRIISGFTPGGPTDVLARTLAMHLQPRWGQPVVAESRPGVGGNLAAEYVARQPPDGHTLLIGVSAQVQNTALFERLPYHPVNDFTPIILNAYYPVALIVPTSFPAQTLAEFVAYAKANPGRVNMGSSGVGNTPHLAAALFALRAGVEFTHVQYGGASAAQIALIAGEVQGMFQSMLLAKQAVEAGRARVLATTGTERWPAWPDVPTIAEQGFPGYEAGTWFGVQGPAGIPAGIVRKIHDDMRDVFRIPEVRQRLTSGGFGLREVGPDEFRAIMVADVERWARVVREANIRAQ